MAHALSQPSPEQVPPEQAAAVLERLGLDWVAPGDVHLPAPPVIPLSQRDARDWWVGQDAMVSYLGSPEDFPHRGRWACDCTAGVSATCPHVAKAILLHAWNIPRLRPLFEKPAWSLQLGGLVRARSDDDEGRDPPEGFVRYQLLDARERSTGLPIKRELVRLSKRDGRELRPQAVPDSLEALVGRVESLADADIEFHQLCETLTVLRRSPARADELGGRLRDDAMQRLLWVESLHDQDRPLHAQRMPFVPVLRAIDGDEGIELGWKDPVVAFFDLGRGYVVTEDGRFAGLPREGVQVSAEALLDELPVVPPEDAARFLEDFVERSGVPVELHSAHLPPTVAPERVEGRVRLDEAEEGLRVTFRVGYVLGEAHAEVSPREAGAHVRVGRALVIRDLDREQALRARLERLIGRRVPAVLRGDSALDFLIDGPDALGEGWAFFGEQQLTRHRLRDPLEAQVRVPSNVDWFDLKVSFASDEHEIDAAQVLASWTAGKRYHRLPDGTLARLPEQWLQRYGALSAEIEDVRKATGGRLAPFAAPMVMPLLDQADGEIDRWTDAMSKLADLDGVPQREVPAELCGELRDYQHAGFRWICFLRDLGLAGCLADDMGLGKTLQSITALLETHRPGGEPVAGPPSLVVSPTSVVYNWAAELERFAPALRVRVHHGPDRSFETSRDADIVITSYALLRQDAPEFTAHPWRWAVLDEAQQIKNPTSQVARTARALDAAHRIALTGTPLENHLLELWSIFEFLMPGFFGSRAAFVRRYVTPVQRNRDPEAVRALRRRLRPFVLRRHKSEVARELPPRQEQTLYCELEPKQRELYERVKATYRESVLKRVGEKGVRAATLPVLEALMRLRQAACDPGLLPFPEARAVRRSAKVELLFETLEEVTDAGHRTLVFSQWPSFLKRIVDRIEARGWPYLYLDGRTTKRHELVEKWNDPDGPPVFLISLKAGGHGLNLTGADHVIHLDPWWNPAVEDQATDRAHRIGQTRPVMAYKLVARDTVEEKILELQDRKRALFEAAVERDRLVVEQLSREDLEAVFAPIEDVAPLSRPNGNGSSHRRADDLDALLSSGERITNAAVRDATGWDAEEARRWLQLEVESGRLERHGRKRGTWYSVT